MKRFIFTAFPMCGSAFPKARAGVCVSGRLLDTPRWHSTIATATLANLRATDKQGFGPASASFATMVGKVSAAAWPGVIRAVVLEGSPCLLHGLRQVGKVPQLAAAGRAHARSQRGGWGLAVAAVWQSQPKR